MRFAVALCVMCSVAHADVTLDDHGTTTDLTVFLTGRDTWELSATAKDITVKLTLPALKDARGKTATLERAGKPKLTGTWVVTITQAAVGYLKRPGLCSGSVTVTFGKDLRVAGTFTDAGCLSYRQKS